MPLAALNINLTANLQQLRTDLDQAAVLSQQAEQRIQKSADEAGSALGEAANAADFGQLSKDAQAASASIDGIKTASVGAGTAVGGLNDKVSQLLDQLTADAKERAEQVGTGTKIAVAATVAAIGYTLVKLGEYAAAAAFNVVRAVVAVGEFTVGLATGESLQSKYIDSLIATDVTVKNLQVSLGTTAESASALTLALARTGVPKEDFVSVYTATETAIRKVIQAQNDLQAKLNDARATNDTDKITEAEKAVASYTNAFDRLGVQYQDNKGKLLSYDQTIANASKVLATYTAGYDQNAAAAELGIGSAQKVADAAKINSASLAEAAQRQRDYYLVIGPGAQAAVSQYQDAMRIFKNESDLMSQGFQRAVADSTIPILTELANLFKDGIPEAVGVVRGVLTGLVAVFNTFELSAKAVYEILDFVFDALEISVAGSMGAINKALHFDFSGAKKEVEDAAVAIEARFNKLLDNTSSNLSKAIANIDLAAGKDSTGNPGLVDKPSGGQAYTPPIKVDDPAKKTSSPNVDVAKKQLDEELKALDVFVAEEHQLLTGREEFLTLYYQHSDISIADYFSGRKVARDADVASAQKAYAQEIADINAYIAKTQGNSNLSDDQKAARVAEAQTKLIDIRGKLRKVESDANTETLKDWFANQKAVEQYGDSLKSLEAQLSTLGGDTAHAFTINFDQQNRDLKRQLSATLNSDSSTQADRNSATQGLIDLDQLKQQGIATAKLNDLNSQRSVILGDLANQQSRVDLAVSRGTTLELQGLADTSAANAAKIDQLQKIIDAEQKIADAIGDPFAKSQALVQVDTLRVQLEQLKTQTNLVADAFNDAGRDVTENFLEKITDRTTTARDKLKGLFDDIEARVLKQGSDVIGNYLFGKDGGLLAGAGNWFSSFFKGAAPNAGAAVSGAAGAIGKVGSTGTQAANSAAFTTLSTNASAAASSLAPLSPTAVDLGAAFDDLLISADAASEALDSVASSGGGDELASLAGDIPSAKGNVFMGGNVIPFARGGIVTRPTQFPMALMGEAGPEAIVPLRPTDRPYRDRNGKMRVADGSGGWGGGQSITNVTNINVPTTQTRDLRTAKQLGRAVSRGLS